jgi:hypothetical protein
MSMRIPNTAWEYPNLHGICGPTFGDQNLRLKLYTEFIFYKGWSLLVGFPPKLFSLEFRSEFRSKLISTFDEIIGLNYPKDNFNFDSRNRNSDTQSKKKFWLISMKNVLKFRHWYWNLVPNSESESEFRSRNRTRKRNSEFDIETEIEIPISTSKPK